MCYSALVQKDLKRLQQLFNAALDDDAFEEYTKWNLLDPKKFPEFKESRIYPKNFAPIVYHQREANMIRPMQYSVTPPQRFAHAKDYTSFNARRDNLNSIFWSECFLKHHGIIVIKAFFEWVSVQKLTQGGNITLEQAKEEFAAQSQKRKLDCERQQKTYKPTPTELKDPSLRQIVIKFKPETFEELFVPVIFSTGSPLGFAIVTDNPPKEVSAAGHDRCPVILTQDAASDWLLAPAKNFNSSQCDQILSRKLDLKLDHVLDHAA